MEDRWNRGFTLIEVLIALVIVAVALVGVLQYSSRLGGELAEIQQRNIMTMIGGAKINEIVEKSLSPSMRQAGSFPNFPDYRWEVRAMPTTYENWYIARLRVYNRESGYESYFETMFRGGEFDEK